MKKKKVAHKKTVARTRVTHVAPKSSVSYRRIILISSSFVLLLFTFVMLNKHSVSQSVAGMSITKGLYNQATVSWKPVNGAVAYNIYYKQTTDLNFINAVRHVPANLTSYTISYLKKNTSYQYKVTAINSRGAEFSPSQILYMNNLMSM